MFHSLKSDIVWISFLKKFLRLIKSSNDVWVAFESPTDFIDSQLTLRKILKELKFVLCWNLSAVKRSIFKFSEQEYDKNHRVKIILKTCKIQSQFCKKTSYRWNKVC